VSADRREIRRLLVANRGEIARRIERTAASMGIETVAVYASVDAGSPYVSEADHAVALTGRGAAETYLDAGQLLAAAEASGADAVHPGYGFLSERASFARAVLSAGLVWVGPSPDVIEALGDKLRAKDLMTAAGIPVLPSIVGRAPVDISWPLVVKAASGGGGKGMRIVESPDEFPDALAAARREAEAYFGDDTVFAERYLPEARHIEIQVLADHHGNVVHCFERECSIQRRHQKVVEEAPSPALDAELREEMTEAAVSAARAVGYSGAGTVEFIVSPAGQFWFLEVNTRLQVEHPVTEAVTGLDLVREQLRIAQGDLLGFRQADLRAHGHAIEVRLYAEDPARGFLPTAGTVVGWRPAAHPTVRFDSGIEVGSIVGADWDPLLAKVIAHAPTRSEAALSLALALQRTVVRGLTTNRDFLVATLRHPEFLAGRATTSFIERLGPELCRPHAEDELRTAAIVACLVRQVEHRASAGVLASLPSGYRNSVLPPERTVWRLAGRELVVEWRAKRDGMFEVAAGGLTSVAWVRHCARSGDTRQRSADVGTGSGGSGGAGSVDLELDGRRLVAEWQHEGSRWWVQDSSGEVELDELPRFPEPEAETVPGGLSSPMPGSVLSVAVAPGDVVVEGQLLVVVEAMKMEHRVTAPHGGRVSDVRVAVGDQVRGELLVVLEEVVLLEKAGDEANAEP